MRAVPLELLRALYEQYSMGPVWLLTGSGAMILDRDVRYRLDQQMLDSVMNAGGRIEQRLPAPLDAKKKARLIRLLYKQCQLLGESTDRIFKESGIGRLARLSR